VTARSLFSAAALSLAAAGAPLHAQAADENAGAARGPNPTVERVRSAAHAEQDSTALAPAALDVNRQLRRSETLMIVGLAAFIAGAIIEGDAGTIVMITGAAIGLYGLYLFLQ
jgi:hypothetical protein